MASEAARLLVQQFQAAGVSLAELGRALERDSGALSQIARGARGAGYGANLVPALEALRSRVSTEAGALLPAHQVKGALRVVADTHSLEVPRRRTKAGRIAQVRAGVKQAGPKDAARPGLFTKGTAGSKGGNLRTVLDAAQQSGQLVYINVTTGEGKRIGLGARSADDWRALGLGLGGEVGDELDDCIESLVDAGELSPYAGEASVAAWSASMIAG